MKRDLLAIGVAFLTIGLVTWSFRVNRTQDRIIRTVQPH
jgi:hypothetical protein